jgi:hypothetical protein
MISWFASIGIKVEENLLSFQIYVKANNELDQA